MSCKFNPLPCKRWGFTSIEFMGAMVIGAIISVLAIGSYRLYERELPVRHAARRLVHALSSARALAISQNLPYAVLIDRRYQNFWVDQVNAAGATTVPKVVSPEPFGKKVQLIDIQFGLTPVSASATDPVVIRFFPDGSSEDARIFLRMINAPNAPAATYTVRNYGPTGQARVFENQQLATTTGP
jgi:Tfp pilus assembly protein FimT